jgi:20S proteasome alpha/beta subunit
MTVCIGALCKHDNDQAVVVAADRMVTYGPPMNLQTEPSLTKILPMTDRCVFLFSGPSFDGEEIARRVRSQISGSKHTIRQISDRVLTSYAEFKQKRAEDNAVAASTTSNLEGAC